MTYLEDSKTYESKAAVLNVYEIENGKSIKCIGKTILDISDYISNLDHQEIPAGDITIPLTLPIFKDGLNDL